MKKSKQIVTLCLVIAVIVFLAIIHTMLKGNIEAYNDAKLRKADINESLQKMELQNAQIDRQKEKDALELKSIKPVMKAPEISDNNSLSVFGDMFSKIITTAKENGLLIRTIEYEMNPNDDVILKEFGDLYNVCELKFFFVGTYIQLRSFIDVMVNNFEYLVSVSKLNVTAFTSNTDYILVNMSITIYSQK